MELISEASFYSNSTASLTSCKLSDLVKPELPDVLEQYVECQGVRISPGQIIFNNAIEGKMFCEKFTIQNVGTRSAFIRILPANSHAFHVKPIVHGTNLGPGLVIERQVRYQLLRATSIANATIPVIINDARVDFKLFVVLSNTDIKAEPSLLDFGAINAGNNAVVRMLSIRNDGSRGSRFTIDLGRNEMELLVEPSKGIIQPMSVTKFRVECLGTTSGYFIKEFWIKCETPLRIIVTGHIIYPELQPIHPNATSDFTLIDFPKTYVGTSMSKTFLLKNYSSTHGVFCTFIENKRELLEAKRSLRTAFNFKMVPSEGIMEPFETRIFEFQFIPKLSGSRRPNVHYLTSFCSFRIIRIPFSSLPKIESKDNEFISQNEIRSQHYDDTTSLASEIFSLGDSIVSVESSSQHDGNESMVTFQSYNSRIVVFGEAELPNVTVRPDSISLGSVLSNEILCREILLKNHSTSLPIDFRFKDVCYVHVQPKAGTLPPDGGLELAVTITASALGSFNMKIAFDLLFYNRPRDEQDLVKIGEIEIPISFTVTSKSKPSKPKFNMGITPTYIKEVGISTDDVRFNTKTDMPRATLMKIVQKTVRKDDDDLVAFPNDRPQTLRPWRSSVRCRTICANIYREINADPDEYQLSEKEMQLRQTTRQYFRELIKYEMQRRQTKSDALCPLLRSDSENVLLKNFPKIKFNNKKVLTLERAVGIIPLTPSQLSKIKVLPTTVNVGKIAPKTSKSAVITIDNKSNACISVFLKSRKPVITFDDGQLVMVKSMRSQTVTITYQASNLTGNYCAIVDCIINCCDTFSIRVMAHVMPKIVRFSYGEVLIGDRTQFLNVSNPINVPIYFYWKIPESCFIIEPSSGTIPSYSSVTCVVKFTPNPSLPLSINATLCSENTAKQIVNITKLMTKTKVKLRNSTINFDNIPLNTTVIKSTIIENQLQEPVTFTVNNPEPIPGIQIIPTSGLILGYSEEVLEIRVKIPTCLTFQCCVKIDIQLDANVKLTLIGTVVYPHIVFKPNVLKLRKIVPHSFDRQVFTISNKSAASVTIEFLLSDYVEYTIVESPNYSYLSIPVTKLEINANSQKQLFLFFHPMGAALYTFYLPVVINHVFGPPVFNCQRTIEPTFYTNLQNEQYYGLNDVHINPLPKKLPVLFVTSSVGCDVLTFNKVYFDFNFFDPTPTTTEAKSDLIIWNATQDTCKFCIRTDNLVLPFSLTHISGEEVEILEHAIVTTLEPRKEVVFKVSFNPTVQGAYFNQLPVYLRNYFEGDIFGCIILSGQYPNPLISSGRKNVYFEPVPLAVEAEQRIGLIFEHHNKNCVMSVKVNSKELKVILCERSFGVGDGTMTAKIICTSKTPAFIDSSVKFSCTCGGTYKIFVKGCVDNCFLTNHAFMSSFVKKDDLKTVGEAAETESSLLSTNESIIYDSITPFPFFPAPDETSDYSEHMNNVVIALEQWISHQCFYGRKYYKIPDTIAMSPEPCRLNNFDLKKKTAPPTPLRYVELLINLIGHIVRSYVTIHEIPADDLQRVNYMYNSYEQVLQLLSSQGAYLAHVFAETLLSYSDHVLFVNHILPYKPKSSGKVIFDVLSKENYYLLTKQQWIDLLLQTYKVFVLDRVRVPHAYKSSVHFETSGLEKIISTESTLFKLESNLVFVNEDEETNSFKLLDDSEFWSTFDSNNTSKFCNTSEMILLQWLTFFFKKQAKEWCQNQDFNDTLSEKVIANFDLDLQDSVAFIAVTLQYCSYLGSYLKDIYLVPTSAEEKLHNAAEIIQAWNVINLSFYVSPKDIVESNCVHMLMLVNYLYQILPSFSANNSMTFKTGLSTVCSKEILIENLGDCAVSYMVTILENQRKLFSVNNTEFLVQRQSKFKLVIKFQAKFLNPETGVVIINGECSGKPYAKSMAIRLVGEPFLSNCSSTFHVPIPMYELRNIDLEIQSPYVCRAKYGIHFTLSELNNETLAKITSVSSMKHSKIPRRITFLEDTVEFDESGVGSLPMIVCPITCNEKPIWVIFRNSDVGDFIVNVISTPVMSSQQCVMVDVPVDQYFSKVKCLCRKDRIENMTLNRECPRVLVAQIPCRNNWIWETSGALLFQLIRLEDMKFWGKYLSTRAGIHIKKWLIELEPFYEDYEDIAEVFQTTVKFDVIVEDCSPNIQVPDVTTIPDVFSDDSHELYIHVGDQETKLKPFVVRLQSMSGFERRYFKIQFVRKSPSFNM